MGAHNIPSLGSTTGISQSHSEICQNFYNLTPDQQRMCSRGQRALGAISLGARLGQDECQHQFRHSRWNCTVAPDADTLYGEVITISKFLF